MWGSSSSSSSSGKKSKRKSKSSGGGFDEDAVETLFAQFADEEDPTVIEMDGIAKLCEELDLDPESDIRILVLLWRLGSKEKPAQISKEEFTSGCNDLQIDSIEKFKSLLPSLDTGFLDREEFKDFYKVRGNISNLRRKESSCFVRAITPCISSAFDETNTHPFISFNHAFSFVSNSTGKEHTVP